MGGGQHFVEKTRRQKDLQKISKKSLYFTQIPQTRVFVTSNMCHQIKTVSYKNFETCAWVSICFCESLLCLLFIFGQGGDFDSNSEGKIHWKLPIEREKGSDWRQSTVMSEQEHGRRCVLPRREIFPRKPSNKLQGIIRLLSSV